MQAKTEQSYGLKVYFFLKTITPPAFTGFSHTYCQLLQRGRPSSRWLPHNPQQVYRRPDVDSSHFGFTLNQMRFNSASGFKGTNYCEYFFFYTETQRLKQSILGHSYVARSVSKLPLDGWPPKCQTLSKRTMKANLPK